jgi:hypothetical protein
MVNDELKAGGGEAEDDTAASEIGDSEIEGCRHLRSATSVSAPYSYEYGWGVRRIIGKKKLLGDKYTTRLAAGIWNLYML